MRTEICYSYSYPKLQGSIPSSGSNYFPIIFSLFCLCSLPFCSTRISKVGKCVAFQLWTPTYFKFVFWDTIVRVASEVHNKWRFQLFDRVHPSSRCHLFSSCRWSRVLEQFRKVKWKRFSSSFPFGYCLSIGHPETAQLIKNCNFFLQVFLSPQISTCERSEQCFTPPPPWSLYFQ